MTLAPARERQRRGAADAARRTGDEGHLGREASISVVHLLFSVLAGGHGRGRLGTAEHAHPQAQQRVVDHGQVIPVSEGGPSNLFIGTYLPGHGTIVGFKRSFAAETRRRIPLYRHTPALKIPAGAVLHVVEARHPSKPAESALLIEAGRNLSCYALGDPLAFARMTVGKVLRMWGRGFHSPQPAVIAAHLALLVVALAGVLLGLRARLPAAAVIAAIAAWSTVDNAILVAEPRHNMPLMPALAAVGIAALIALLRARAS
jgi:hypothetical protein